MKILFINFLLFAYYYFFPSFLLFFPQPNATAPSTKISCWIKAKHAVKNEDDDGEEERYQFK